MTSFVAYRNTSLDLGVASAVYRLVSTVADWRAARRTVRVLSALSDHELDDIGLTRGEILAVARRGVRG